MKADETRPADEPISQPDPFRFAGGGQASDYAALPDEPAEVVAMSGAANEVLTQAEMGALDGDD